MITTAYFPEVRRERKKLWRENSPVLVSCTFLLIIIHNSYRHRRIKGSSSEKNERKTKPERGEKT